MSINYRSALLASLAAGGMLSSTSAFAQAAAPVAGAPPSGGGATIAEVVVTARRRAESLQNVPVAITALSRAVLQRQNIHVLEDVQYVTPSLTVQGGSYNRLGNGFAIRGTPSAGTLIYRDEVPGLIIPGQGGAPTTPFFDIDSVQVLKGPQGTLFGGTTTGGAILITTAKPTDQFSGYLQGSYGNLNATYIEGALNIPVVEDKVLLRVAGDVRRRDGYTLNVFTGTHVDNQHTDSVRVSLALKPTTYIENDTVYEYNYRSEYLGNSVPIFCNVNSYLNNGAGNAPGSWYQACVANSKLGPRKVSEDINALGRLQEHYLTNITTVHFGRSLVLKNVFGFVSDATGNRNDSDGTAIPAGSNYGVSETINPYSQTLMNLTNQYSDEVQIQGRNFDDQLNWIVGGFYRGTQDPHVNGLLAAVVAPLGPPIGNIPFFVDVTSKSQTTEEAVFAQATYNLGKLIQGLSLTGGVRETWDSNKTLSQNLACEFPAMSPSAQTCSPLDPVVPTNPTTSATTYNITADYKPTNNVLIYVANRHGYRPGGVQPFAPAAFQVFKAETNTDWEVGLKSTWRLADIPIRINLDVYSDDYQNFQWPLSLGPTTGVTVNAQNATLRGFELDGEVVLTSWLTIDAGLALHDDQMKKFIAVLPSGAVVNEAGTPLPLAPKSTFNITGTVTVPTPENVGRLTLTANYSYRSLTYIAADTYFQPDFNQPAYGLLNLQVQLASIGGRPIDISVFAKNLTDKVYIDGSGNYTYHFNPGASSGVDTAFYGEPRTYGVTLRYHFGG
jgi:iron complex outermembrane receptor protein